jgi:hypothetical protein
MRLPKKVIIAGHEITVRYARGLVDGENDCWGLYKDSNHTIYIKSGMDSSRKQEIFLHEIIHAIDHIHVLNLSEKAVKILGIEILGLFKNNRFSIRSKKITSKL